MRLIFLPQAETDLEAIGDYIARDNPRRAMSFVRELRAQCRKIAKAPKAYRPRPELGPGLRSCPYGNYLVLFLKSLAWCGSCGCCTGPWTSKRSSPKKISRPTPR